MAANHRSVVDGQERAAHELCNALLPPRSASSYPLTCRGRYGILSAHKFSVFKNCF
jgi:poly-beta-hydroxyalkanoate depolymerase